MHMTEVHAFFNNIYAVLQIMQKILTDIYTVLGIWEMCMCCWSASIHSFSRQTKYFSFYQTKVKMFVTKSVFILWSISTHRQLISETPNQVEKEYM